MVSEALVAAAAAHALPKPVWTLLPSFHYLYMSILRLDQNLKRK